MTHNYVKESQCRSIPGGTLVTPVALREEARYHKIPAFWLDRYVDELVFSEEEATRLGINRVELTEILTNHVLGSPYRKFPGGLGGILPEFCQIVRKLRRCIADHLVANTNAVRYSMTHTVYRDVPTLTDGRDYKFARFGASTKRVPKAAQAELNKQRTAHNVLRILQACELGYFHTSIQPIFIEHVLWGTKYANEKYKQRDRCDSERHSGRDYW